MPIYATYFISLQYDIDEVFTVEETAGQDKLTVLQSVLARSLTSSAATQQRTLIFCNTIDSCRAVQYALNDDPSSNAGRL